MNHYFLIAALLATLVGVVHSVLGEILVFNKLRSSSVIPRNPAPPLQSRNIRILWASWHLASIFGFASSYIFYQLAHQSAASDDTTIIALIAAFAVSSALALYATNGKHSGWIGLLAVAVFAYLGRTV